VVLAVQLAFLAVIWRLAVSYAPPGVLFALDALAAPGAEARIGVRLERENPFFPTHALAGARVIFESDGPGDAAAWTPVGTATSGPDGVASVTIRAPETPGIRVYRASIDPASDGRSAGMEAEVLLDVEPVDRALVLVVLPAVPAADPLFTAGGRATPSGRSAAAIALGEIAATRPVAYIAPTTDGARAVRPWLDREGFPRGPVLLAPATAHGASPVSSILAGLEPTRHREKSWGIASTSEDAAAFTRARIRVVLLGGSREKTEGVVPAADWQEAARIIKG
jgi:hypothetical protein